jgi:predicted metalloprotease with PDZ domain
MKNMRRYCAAVVLLLILQAAPSRRVASAAPQAAPRLDYTIRVADAPRHLFHITIQVSNATEQTLDLSLPAWTPGWYTIMPYAAYVQKLHAKDAQGRRLPLRAIDKQTWRIETGGHRALTVEYDYLANNLSVNGAELNERRGYFLGTNLFFYAVGHTTDTPSTVKFEVPDGWRIATGLKRGTEPATYLARNFDNLVDCPVVMGDFDDNTTTVNGKTIHIVVDPKGQMSDESRASLREMTGRVIDAQAKMFGGLPYDDYWVLFVRGGNVRVGGALEHENSTNLVGGLITDPRFVIGTVSHEHFHVWNVKRVKPAGLIPYDYSREQYIRELWVSEGFTSYYSDLHLRRARVITPEEYLQRQAGQIGFLQQNEARRWISVADASITTWTTYTGGGPFTVNYYNKGQLLGLLLDLEIRGATDNRRSLDDVMRRLFEDHYQRGRGFTDEDVERIAAEVAGRSFKDFFARCVHGTDELDYNSALAHAGLRLEEKKSDGQSRQRAEYKIVEIEQATAAQRALRRSWLGQ